MPVFKWSKTAAANATADATINWAEGQAPSSVNDSGRAEMAAVKKWHDDISGSLTTGGTPTAFTLTTNSGFDSLANMSGSMVAFVPHATNGGACTLNVDGLGAKPLRSAPSVELSAGDLIQGTPYLASYFNAAAEWILMGGGAMPTYVPLGALMDYTGTTAPNSRFVLPFGQAISRTTYANYFALAGTTYGAGDGSTTFNVPDLRGRTVFGKDDMGGSAASRLTAAATGGINGAGLGNTGGEQAHPLTTAELAAHGHNFSGTTGSANSSLDHTHNFTAVLSTLGNWSSGGSGFGAAAASVGTSAGANSSLDHTHNFSGTTANAGSGNGHNTVPPGIVLNKILRVL